MRVNIKKGNGRTVGRYGLLCLVLLLVFGGFLLESNSRSMALSPVTMELLGLSQPANGTTTITTTTTTTTRKTSPMSIARPRIGKLPNLSMGGIVIFFHVPKTGGTSVTDTAKKAQWGYASNRKKGNQGGMGAVKKIIDEWVENPATVMGEEGTKVKFVELHWDLESALSLEQQIVDWRAKAEANGIPFFVFTMIRDPLDAYLSTFNFFCIYLAKGKYVNCPGPWTVDRMKEVSPDNPQSRWLCDGITMNFDQKPLAPIHEICQPNLIPMMQRSFDWVGDMNRFSETWMVIESMLGVPLPRAHSNKVNGVEKISRADLTAEDHEYFKKELAADAELVDWVARTYTLHHFGITAPPAVSG